MKTPRRVLCGLARAALGQKRRCAFVCFRTRADVAPASERPGGTLLRLADRLRQRPHMLENLGEVVRP
jgi:hypothetical protein